MDLEFCVEPHRFMAEKVSTFRTRFGVSPNEKR
jgi:hypothetical protein